MTNEQTRELTDKEQARMRVAVFFGSSTNFRHSYLEILGNGIDEVMKGLGRRLEVTQSMNGTRMKVKDYANGLPVEIPSNTGKEGYIAQLETLFAGGKFDQGTNYSLGLNGVGLATTILTSEYAKVTVGRPNGNIYQIEYQNGDRLYDMKIIGQTDTPFTEIEWTPDKKVFSDNVFDWEDVCSVAQGQTAIAKVEIVCINEDTGEERVYQYENGVTDYLGDLVICDTVIDIETFEKSIDVDFEKTEDKFTDKMKMTFAFTITSSEITQQIEFLNSSNLEYHGTIQEGIINGFKYSVNKYLKDKGMYEAKEKQFLNNEDILASLNYVADVKSLYPEFENQIKKKTLVPHYKDGVQDMIKDYLDIFFMENPIASNKMCKQILVNKRAREKSSKMMENLVKKFSAEITGIANKMPDLMGCRETDPDKTIICFMEGKSALTSVATARDSNTMACYPLRGKILNIRKADMEKIFKSDIICNIIRLLGCGIEIKNKYTKEFSTFDIDKLRYGKIYILVDADVDGVGSILPLLLNMLAILMPQLLIEGRVYLIGTPKYEILCEDTYHYAVDDKQLKEIEENLRGKKYKTSYVKGLGELDVHTMALCLKEDWANKLQITVENFDEAMKTLELWLGEKVEPRKEYILNHF